MRFSSLIISLLFLAACQSDQNNSSADREVYAIAKLTVAKDALVNKPGEGLAYYSGKPFTGTSLTYYANGKKSASMDYVRGKKDGLYRKWFEDGLLSFESHYTAGKREGVTRSWWRNGNLRSESRFLQGHAHGIQKQWYTSGAKFKVMNLNKGKEEGMQKSWRENGKVYNNYEAKNGRIFGLKRANLCFQLEDENIQYED